MTLTCRRCEGCGFIDEAPGQRLLCPGCYGQGQVEEEEDENYND